MFKLEIYDGTKLYMSSGGTLYTQERLLEEFPSALAFKHVIMTDEGGETAHGVLNLNTTKSMYGVPQELTDAEAMSALEKILNAPLPEPTLSPADEAALRQAEALEAIADGQTTESAAALNELIIDQEYRLTLLELGITE